MMRKSSRQFEVSVAVAAILLVGAAAQRLEMPSPADAKPYHERLQTVAGSLASRLDDWSGVDIQLPVSAVTLLHPNVQLGRDYTNLVTAEHATFLLVQCSDARDLIGHYPPNCYPSSGWILQATIPLQMEVAGQRVDATEYHFSSQLMAGKSSMVVYNTMLLPRGGYQPDMASVRKAAAQLKSRGWGAAQIQVLLSEAIPPTRREEIFASMLQEHHLLIDAIVRPDQLDPEPARADENPDGNP